MTDPIADAPLPPFGVSRGPNAVPRLTVDETFTWTRFEMTCPVEVPTNPGGAYTTELSAQMIQVLDDDDVGAQVWSLTVKVPTRDGGGQSMTEITKSLTVPGWREAVDHAQRHLLDLAAKAAVAIEARRLFNHAVRNWTGSGLPNLDINDGLADGVLEAIGSAYSGRYRVLSNPFDDIDQDETAGQDVN